MSILKLFNKISVNDSSPFDHCLHKVDLEWKYWYLEFEIYLKIM